MPKCRQLCEKFGIWPKEGRLRSNTLISGCYYATAPVPRLTNGLRLTETVQNTVFCEDETAG